MLEALEHADGRALGDHGGGVVGIGGVAGEHELGHDEAGGDGAEFGLEDFDVAAGVDGGGGELVVGVGEGVEDGAWCVAAEVAGLAGHWIGAGFVGAVLDELVDGAACAGVVFADDGDGRLDLGDDAHVAEQLFGAAEVFADGVEEGQPAFDVGIDVGFAVLDMFGVDPGFVDAVVEDGFDVVGVGADSEGESRVVFGAGGRGDLFGFDEADVG